MRGYEQTPACAITIKQVHCPKGLPVSRSLVRKLRTVTRLFRLHGRNLSSHVHDTTMVSSIKDNDRILRSLLQNLFHIVPVQWRVGLHPNPMLELGLLGRPVVELMAGR